MRVFDNVAFGLRVRPRRVRPSRAEIARRVEALLELVQLEAFADRYPSQLSGGQRQRVALARALAVEPRVLLLDEPFGALDARVRKELRRWLRRLHEQMQVTTMFVTHDQEEALELADRVVIMNHGVIEQVGAPQDLYHHPRTKFVAGFIGSPAMNFIPARLENRTGALSLALPNGVTLPVPAHRTARYRSHADRDVIFGIRPEHLTEVKPTEKPTIAIFEARPEVIEPMGLETLVYFWIQGHEVSARIDPAVPVEVGQPLRLALDLDHMHLIDPVTDRVL
jgi:multiple sugar transport system ATP-binding protein